MRKPPGAALRNSSAVMGIFPAQPATTTAAMAPARALVLIVPSPGDDSVYHPRGLKQEARLTAGLLPHCLTASLFHRLGLSRLGNELERQPVVAPALAGGRRAVVEHVPVVAAAALAVIFGAREEQQVIGLGFEHAWDGREKARPAGAAVELHGGGVDGQIAARANEHAFALLPVERAAPGTLGTLFAQHPERVRREALAPLVLRELQRLARKRRLVALGQVHLPVLLQLLDALHVLHL